MCDVHQFFNTLPRRAYPQHVMWASCVLPHPAFNLGSLHRVSINFQVVRVLSDDLRVCLVFHVSAFDLAGTSEAEDGLGYVVGVLWLILVIRSPENEPMPTHVHPPDFFDPPLPFEDAEPLPDLRFVPFPEFRELF